MEGWDELSREGLGRRGGASPMRHLSGLVCGCLYLHVCTVRQVRALWEAPWESQVGMSRGGKGEVCGPSHDLVCVWATPDARLPGATTLSNALTVGTTLGVTGATTLGGALSVSGEWPWAGLMHR